MGEALGTVEGVGWEWDSVEEEESQGKTTLGVKVGVDGDEEGANKASVEEKVERGVEEEVGEVESTATIME